MRIKFVIEDNNGKNVLFITHSGDSLTLDEALVATQNGTLENIHVVNSDKTITFIRSNPNKTEDDNLDSLLEYLIGG